MALRTTTAGASAGGAVHEPTGKRPIGAVLATNLKHFMRERGYTQAALASKAGVAQRTIGNYLNPDLRQAESKSGKAPSAKLTEVEKICAVLGLEVWEMLRPISPKEREFYRQIEESFQRLRRTASGLHEEDAQAAAAAEKAEQHHE